MGHQVWMYHQVHGAKIFNSDELEHIEDGWKDSPAEFINEPPMEAETEENADEPFKRGRGRPRKIEE